MREKGGFWGSMVTDNEVDSLLQHHGEYDTPLKPMDSMRPSTPLKGGDKPGAA